MALLLIYNKCITLSLAQSKDYPSVLISWLFCHVILQSINAGSTFKRLVKHQTEMLFYSILTIPKLQHSDRGRYTCRVTSGDQSQHKQVNVIVYGEFPPLTHPDIQEIHRQLSARITHSSHACLIFLSFCDQRILYHRLQNVTAVSKIWRQLF